MKVLQNLLQNNQCSLSEASELVKIYTVFQPDVRRRMTYVSNLFRPEMERLRVTNDAAVSKIVEGVYLGRIPQKGEAEAFKKNHPNFVLVIRPLEDFEDNDEGFVSMGVQTSEGWKSLGVQHYQIPVKDNTKNEVDFPPRQLARAVGLMKRTIEAGNQVLVHCRAGRSRSATVVLAYLRLMNPGVSNADLHKQIMEKRPVCLGQPHFTVVDAFIDLVNKEPGLLSAGIPIQGENISADNLRRHIDTYLQSLAAKDDIAQLSALKKLKKLAINKGDPILTLTNSFLAGLCVINSASDLVNLIKTKDGISVQKQQIFDEIIDLLNTVFKIPAKTIEEEMSQIKGELVSLEPKCDRSQNSKHNATVFLTFTDPDKGLMLLVANKSEHRNWKRYLQTNVGRKTEYNTIKTPGGEVDLGDSIPFTALKELKEEGGVNYANAMFNNAKFYFIQSIELRSGEYLHAYCLNLGKICVPVAEMKKELGIETGVARSNDDIDDLGFLVVQEQIQQPELAHCFGNMKARNENKKFDSRDQIILKTLVENEHNPEVEKFPLQKVLDVYAPSGELSTDLRRPVGPTGQRVK